MCPLFFFFFFYKVKVKVSHSLIAVGAVGVRVPLYLGLKLTRCGDFMRHSRAALTTRPRRLSFLFYSYGIKCYTCTGCNDPFDSSGVTQTDCPSDYSCQKSKAEASGAQGEGRWIDGSITAILRLFQRISIISKQWEGDKERLCEMEPRLSLKGFPPQAGI